MTMDVSRRSFIGAAGMAGLVLLAGCSGTGGSTTASSGASKGSATDAPRTLTVGTLATEDILPLWVAQAEDLYDKRDVRASIVPFQSATELISGVASGTVDLAMTDIMVTASMFASGIDVRMQWVTLGTDSSQGRFGIMAGPDSKVETLEDLAGVPIGVGSNTILEYVMDKLMESAGVAKKDIVVEELQKLPVRYQAMESGEVAAAALPGTLLALGEANGCKLIADDTKGDNLSTSVMIARTELMLDPPHAEDVKNLRAVWDEAAQMVNDDPEAYRGVLVENANLPEKIASTYPLSTYPAAQLPTSAMVDPVLEWMQEKGYLTQTLVYDESAGTLRVK